MKEILEKISHYNLFNYLLPGVLYVVIIEHSTSYSLLTDEIVITAFICYFVGLVISRIGSLVIEKVLRAMKFLKFKDYKEYVAASHKDPKLDTLSEQNNTYRSIIAMLVLVAVTKGYELLGEKVPFFNEWKLWIVMGILIIMFLAAYRKQTKYITERIDKNLQ